MPQVIIQLFRFLILVLLQVFIFSEIQLFGLAIAFPFILFILFLPPNLPTWQVLLISFAIGFLIDFLVGTYGLHAAAATVIGLLKKPLLLNSISNYDEEDDDISLADLNLLQFAKFGILASLLFCTVFYLLDYFSFSALLRIGLQIIASTLFTFICIFCYRYLFIHQTK